MALEDYEVTLFPSNAGALNSADMLGWRVPTHDWKPPTTVLYTVYQISDGVNASTTGNPCSATSHLNLE